MSKSLNASSALVRLSFLVDAIYAEVANKYGLTPAQAQLLCITMDRQRGMTAIASLLRVDKSSLSGLVDRAQQRGLVVRVTGRSDRRTTKIALTDKGRALAEAFHSDIVERLDAVVDGLPGDEGKGFARLAVLIAEAGLVPPLWDNPS